MKKLSDIEAELAALTARKEKLEALREKFPDLEVYRNRWKREYLYSKHALPLANKMSGTTGCSCCTDVPLTAMFFSTHNGENVYAKDPERDGLLYVEIGWKGWSKTWIHDDWKERCEQAGVPEAAIEATKEYAKFYGAGEDE